MNTSHSFRSFPVALFTVLFLSAVGISGAGYFLSRQQQEQTTREQYDQLSAIAEVKSSQIERWLFERLGDASAIRLNPIIVRSVREFIEDPEHRVAAEELQQWMSGIRSSYRYHSLLLCDAQGRLLLSTDPRDSVETDERLLIITATERDSVLSSDLHRCGDTSTIVMDIVVPLGRGNGVLVLRVDATAYLFPLLHERATPLHSFESYIAKDDSDGILILSELRGSPNAALRLRLPLSDSLLSVLSTHARTSAVFTAQDYRNVTVLASLHPVANTGWTLVSQVDADEILSPVRRQLWTGAAITAALLLSVISLTGYFWRRQRTEQFRREVEAKEALRSSEQRFRSIFEESTLVMLLIDADSGRIVDANDAAVSFYGYPREQLLALNIDRINILPPERVAEERLRAQRHHRDYFVFPHRRASGEVRTVEVHSSPIHSGDQTLLFSTVYDITDRRRADERIANLNRVYAFVSEINKAIVRTRERELLYEEVCRIAVETGRFRMAWIGGMTPDRTSVVPIAWSGFVDGYLDNIVISLKDVPEGHGPTGTAIREQQSFFCNDIANDPIMAPWRDRALERGYRSAMALPLMMHGAAIGSISIYAAEEGFFNPEEIELLTHVTEDISYALESIDNERIRLEKENELRLKDIVFETSLSANIIAGADGNVLQVNQSALRLWGYLAPEEVAGRALRSFILIPETAAAIAESVVRYGRWIGEYEAVRKDGSTFMAFAMVTQLRDVEGRFSGFQSSVIDVTERKRSEERIRLLTQALEQASVSVLITDEHGIIHYANLTATLTTGYPLEELVGMDTMEFAVDPGSPELKRMWETISAGNAWSGEFRNIRKGGVIYWASAVIGPIRGENGQITHYISVMEDISERRRLDEAIAESERKYTELVEASLDGVYKSTHDGNFVSVNDALVRMLGYDSQEELMGIDILTELYFAPEDREMQEIEQNDSERSVYRLRRKDGSEIWVEDHGRVIRNEAGEVTFHEGILRDITDRRNAERALKEQQEISSAIIDNANESIAVVDPVTGAFFSFNEQTCQQLGYTREEFQELTLADIKAGVAPGDVPGYLTGLIASGATRFESVHRHKNGSLLHRLVSTRPVTISGREYIVSIWSDLTDVRKTEITLRQLSHAIEQLASTVVITDLQGRIEYVNAAFTRTTGYTRDEVLGQKPSVLKSGFTSDAEYKKMWEAISSGQEWHGEFFNKKKNGDLYWELAVIAPVKDQTGAIINYIAVKEEITERKKAELELQVKESAITSAINAIAFADLSGLITVVNPAFLTMWGYSDSSEVIGRPATEFWQEPDNAGRVQKALFEQRNWSGEMIAIRKDGTMLDVLVSASIVLDKDNSPICLMGSFVDITERKRSERTVRQLSLAIQQASVSVVVTDQNGVIEYVNEASTRTSGYSYEEMVGQKPSLLKSGETGAEVYEQLWRTITAGKEWKGEFRNRRKDGTLYWESVVVAPVKDENGSIVNYIAVKDDITERREMQSQLLRAQRMESIGTLAGGIAHDLNNILGPILLAVQVLRMKMTDNSAQNIINTIETATMRGKNIISQVLSFARGTESKPVLMQVRHIVKEVEEVVRQTFDRNIEIESYIPKDIWTIHADPTQMQQVLMNLCVNARDAMPDGGRLSIHLQNSDIDTTAAARYPSAHAGRYIMIEVQDTGTGIPPEIMQKIFDPFFTTKAMGKGTGLGLATVYSIVKQHQGFIDVHSDPGRGSTFRIFLPAAAMNEPEATETLQEIPQGGHESILVVDDEHPVQVVCREALQYYNYDVETAANGAEGISKFLQRTPPFRVVLLDMMMPVMDGRTAAAAIRKIDPSVRIIGMSGLMSDEPQGDDDRLFDQFLRKPFTGRELMESIHRALRSGH